MEIPFEIAGLRDVIRCWDVLDHFMGLTSIIIKHNYFKQLINHFID